MMDKPNKPIWKIQKEHKNAWMEEQKEGFD